MNTNIAFTWFYTVVLLRYQYFVLRQIEKIRANQPFVDLDVADYCCLYVTTRNTSIFQDGITSIVIDSFENHYVLMFDLTSMRDATENCYYSELAEEPVRLQLSFNFRVQHVSVLIVSRDRIWSFAVYKFVAIAKKM